MGIYIIIFITLIAAFIVSLSQILFKKGLSGKRINALNIIGTILRSRQVLTGALGYFVSLGVYLIALKSAPLSIVYPIFASSFIFVTLLSSFFLKERLSWTRILGIVFIFLGILVISLSY